MSLAATTVTAPTLRKSSITLTDGMTFEDLTLEGQLNTVSAEADLWFAKTQNGNARILKWYRPGVRPTIDAAQLESIQTSNLVRTYKAGQIGDRYYEIMQYYPHGNMTQLTQAQILENFQSIISQLTSALNHLHSLGIQHRDIKPQNVLIASLDPLTLVLGDFGTSAQAYTTALTNARGTLLYSAPEALSGTYSTASDWYALGLLLLEALLGKHPLSTLSPQQQHFALASGQIPLTLPDHFQTYLPMFQGLLNVDYSQRWSGTQILNFLTNPQAHTATPVIVSVTTTNDTAPVKEKFWSPATILATCMTVGIMLGLVVIMLPKQDKSSNPPTTTLTESVVTPVQPGGISPRLAINLLNSKLAQTPSDKLPVHINSLEQLTSLNLLTPSELALVQPSFPKFYYDAVKHQFVMKSDMQKFLR